MTRFRVFCRHILRNDIISVICGHIFGLSILEQKFAKKTWNAYLHFGRKKWTLASIFKFCKKLSGRTFCIKKVSRKVFVNFAKTLSTITICKEDNLVWQFASFAKRYPGRQLAKFVKKNDHEQKCANHKYLITSALSTRK